MTYQCPTCGLSRSANQAHGSVLPQCMCAWQFTPPKREWQGLTDEEIRQICDENFIMLGAYAVDLIESIEAKLKEKNT